MPQYPTVYCYPNGQPIPDPITTILTQQAQQSKQLWELNEKIENRNAQDNNLEEAYSEIIKISYKLAVADKRGNMHLLLDTCFDHAYYICHDSLYGLEAFYVIAIHSIPDHLIISERDFFKPGQLLNAISRASGKQLRLYKSERQTSALIRQHISSIAEELYAPFYLGWHKAYDRWEFEMLNGSTHGRRFHNPPVPSRYKESRPKPSPTNALVATEQILLLFETISNVGIRCPLILWFHAAALTSLISDLGYRIPMGLCIHSTSATVRRHMEAVYAWYGDAAVMLTTQHKRFIDLMVERKDQPFLFIDRDGQQKNSELVLNVIQTGEIPLTVEKNSPHPALSSLPTLLSNDVTMLSASSYFATIEVSDDDLVRCSGERLSGLNAYITDYILGFARFVEDHIDDLQKYLSDGIDDVLDNSSESYNNLTPEGATTLGILFGVRKILSAYYRSLAANQEMENRMFNFIYPANQDIFVNALSTAAECSLNAEDLVSFFFSNLNRMIAQGRFDSRSIYDAKTNIPCAEGKAGIVYSDESYISLTRRAFVAVCRVCGSSGPALLRELSAADVLIGSRINKETSQTRITVYDTNGQSKIAYVYKFDRQSLYDYTN